MVLVLVLALASASTSWCDASHSSGPEPDSRRGRANTALSATIFMSRIVMKLGAWPRNGASVRPLPSCTTPLSPAAIICKQWKVAATRFNCYAHWQCAHCVRTQWDKPGDSIVSPRSSPKHMQSYVRCSPFTCPSSLRFPLANSCCQSGNTMGLLCWQRLTAHPERPPGSP